jgi:opacity protein-like surface antigen
MGRRLPIVGVVAAVAALGIPHAVEARQGPANGPPSAPVVDPVQRADLSADFNLGRPTVTLTLRGGGFAPRAQGQFFDFAFDNFTLERRDLRGLAFGADVGVWVGNHLEVMASLDMAGVTRRTEDRDYVEPTPQGDLPILQSTRLRYGPAVTAGVRVFPLGRGERVSQFIWIPDRVSPFLSAGLGGTGWKVEQEGDFVDDTSEEEPFIFTDRFGSDGISFTSFVGGGLEMTLTPRVALILDTRYVFGEGWMDRDFGDFVQPLDLSGLRLTAGLSFRF